MLPGIRKSNPMKLFFSYNKQPGNNIYTDSTYGFSDLCYFSYGTATFLPTTLICLYVIIILMQNANCVNTFFQRFYKFLTAVFN